MAKDIPRNTLRQLVREYKTNGLFGSASSKTINEKNTLKVYNDTGAVLPAGSFVGLSGFEPTSISYENAHSLMLGGNLVLHGVAASTSLTNAVVTKPIAAGTVGTAECEGVEFIVAHVNDNAHTEISVARETVASGGDYKIISASGADSNNNKVFAVSKKKIGALNISKANVLLAGGTKTVLTGITITDNTLVFITDTVIDSPNQTQVVSNVTLG